VVGLGNIAQSAILPAFANAKRNSKLVALVSDDATKLRLLGKKYRVEHLRAYEDFSEVLEHVDAVFIALPNTLHEKYAIAAARAGVHVLCEKPMAVTEAACVRMIRACRRARVKLMIGYRLHFERANLDAATVVANDIGEPRLFMASFTQDVKSGNLRLRAEEGGPLYDVGIYCLNAARSLFKAEPLAVFAWKESRRGDRRFRECAEMLSVQLRFPERRLATFTCSFGAVRRTWFEVVGTRASVRVDPAFSTSRVPVQYFMTERTTREKRFARRDQFAPELLYFSDCILNDRTPEPSGEEGLADVRILRAIEKSARTGRAVSLPKLVRRRYPTMRQEIYRPRRRKPALVKAGKPT
jgi:predicted dehydrogenase